MNTYIGVDLGTSGTKILLVAANGAILAENTQSYPVCYPFFRSNLQTCVILQLVASPIAIAYSTTCLFSTGSAPGMPVHTGHVWVFGAPPNSVLHPQKIFVFVASSICTSSPMTVSYCFAISFTPPSQSAPVSQTASVSHTHMRMPRG